MFQEVLQRRLQARLSRYQSPEYDLIWKTWDTAGSLVPALRASVRNADQKKLSGWPTPTATNRERDEKTMAKCLAYRKRNANQNSVPLYLGEVARMALPAVKDGQLDPSFPRWLLGMPPAWDEMSPSFRDWQRFSVLRDLV